ILMDKMTSKGSPDINNIKGTDFGLVFGGDLGFNMGQTTFFVDLRYTLGLTQTMKDVDPDGIPLLPTDGDLPDEYPMANDESGRAPDLKNSVISFFMGILF
ncbi:MAG: hypothetical protein JSV44_01375, partial [Candidatus Zixiibacteriota bacterium]